MAETLLRVVTEVLLDKVFSLVAQELSLGWDFKDDLEKFADSLGMVRDLLSDAEGKEVSSAAVRRWLNKLKAVAHDADAAIDELGYEVLRQKVEKKNKVRDLFSPYKNPLAFRVKMARKIKDINYSLNRAYKVASQIGLNPLAVTTAPDDIIKESRHTLPGVGDVEKVVGRDGDVSNIVGMLLSSNNWKNLSVIAIVGLPGQGKTTLAQLVYDNDMVANHFDEKVWMCVSDNFNIPVLLSEMIQSLTSTNPQMSNMEGIIKELRKHLEGKRYLLVLDDVWNEDPKNWESLVNALLLIGGSRESKILVTTRSDVVVSTMQTSLSYRLERLSDHESWTLFKLRAFAEGGAVENSKLVSIGRGMVEKCGGMPLAINMLGGVMYYKKDEKVWLSVQNSQIWNSQEGIGGLMPTLMLSYSHLPSLSLKHCFSYCGIIPKDSEINKDNLIQLWMAVGLLRPPKGSCLEMEDVGNDYFKTLLWSSLLQDVVRDEYGNIIGCKMHGLVHDLALHTSKNYCLTSEASGVGGMNGVVHLSLISKKGERLRFPKRNLRRLHTLFTNSDLSKSTLSDLKNLQVLILSGPATKELPKSVDKLKHLRYLDISQTAIRTLPSSVTKLYNLETLRVYDLEVIPKNFSNLISLRHFYAKDEYWCTKWSLVGIGQLTSLQTIPFFSVRREMGCLIGELGPLDNLKGKLNIYHLEDVRNIEDAKSANLRGKLNLDALNLVWARRGYYGGNEEASNADEEYHVSALEGLEPNSNLRCLEIQNFQGSVFASWMIIASRSVRVLENLVKIVLMGCKRCERLPTLGHLPYLMDIEIVGMDNVQLIGTEFYYGCNDGCADDAARSSDVVFFPALRRLKLKGLRKLEEWVEEVVSPSSLSVVINVFPCLEELIVEGCPILRTAPTQFPRLAKLKYSRMNDTMALKRVSSKLASLVSLEIDKVKGPELQAVMERLLRNNSSTLRTLRFSDCHQFSCFPGNLKSLVALENLKLLSCDGITSIRLDADDVVVYSRSLLASSLKEMWIIGCGNLTEIPDIRSLTSLRELDISGCPRLRSVPSGLEDCTSLERLDLTYCPLLESLPDLRRLTNLTIMGIGCFSDELDYFPWPYDYSSVTSSSSSSSDVVVHAAGASLRGLTLMGWKKLKSLPEKLQLLSALTELKLAVFPEMESLPKWLGNLSSLQTLYLWDCEKLRNLPTVESMQCLTNLKELHITNCPLLEERCTKSSGPEWSKIAQIPQIEITGVMIQDL